MTNELGTTLSDIEAKAERKLAILKRLNELTNVAANNSPSIWYEWLKESEETIRKYIEEN